MIRKIKKSIKNYDSRWWNNDGKKSTIIKNGFFLTLPHIIPTLILILIFPNRWIGILILGIFISDFAINPFIKSKSIKNWLPQALVSHIMLFIVTLIMLIQKEYVIASSGIIHLILDWIGF